MKWLLIIPGVLVGLFVLLTTPVVIMIPIVLLYGWVPAAKRLTMNAPFSALELGIFATGCLVLLVGAHWFVQRIGTWKLRWSVALTGVMAFVLLSIMCMVGMAHQAGWVLLSSEPMFVTHPGIARVRERMDLKNTAQAMAKLAPADLEKLTEAASLIRDGRLPDTRDGKRPWEKYHAIVLGPKEQQFVAICPRDKRISETAIINGEGEVTLEQTNYIHAAKSF